MQCTQFLVVYINRFCEYTIVNMYLLIIVYYVRSMFHFGKEREEKSEKISKSQGFFPQKKKKNGDATRKSSQKLRRRTIYTTSAHSKDFMYGNIMCLKCQNHGYFDWRIRNIFMHKMWTFSLSNVNYNSKKWYFSIASS